MQEFIAPTIVLGPTAQSTLRTLPELVKLNVKNNPTHLFCVQVEKKKASNVASSFVEVTYKKLEQAILRCQKWVNSQIPGVGPLDQGGSGAAVKPAPVALLMESDLGLAVYLLTLMGMGIPVVLLSTRLSPLAVRHLIRRTNAKAIVASRRLQPLCAEAIATEGDGDSGDGALDIETRIAAGYEELLEGETTEGSVALDGHFVSREDRNVVILHSSGTSGLPKPIYCSHSHFIAFSQSGRFDTPAASQGLNISTSPFFHGFGVVPLCLSLAIGKSLCIPSASEIPTGASIADLIEASGTKSLMTVPSIIEEIALLPNDRGIKVLRSLDFVAFGGGIPKTSIGEKLDAAGVRLINHYGATETGPLSPFFVPGPGSDWRFIQLRQDTIEPLEVELEPLDEPGHDGQVYQLSMLPPGWQERFVLQDVLIERPGSDKKEFSIAGRMDDLICLATGEKVRPTILESNLRQQDGVKAVVAFGDQQFELGIIIETFESLSDEQSEKLKQTLWPVVEDAGRQMDAHARITSPTAIIVVPPGSLPRSDKGTILRREVNRIFAQDIDQVYRRLEAELSADAFDPSAPEASVRALMTAHLNWRVAPADWSDDSDFFELGMDSLQAVKLRRLLAASVKAARESGSLGESVVREIADDIVYRNPSVEALARAMTGKGVEVNGVSEQEVIDRLVDLYSGGRTDSSGGSTVVITGSTGSLGSFFLARLLGDPAIARVICLLRPSQQDPLERQMKALEIRSISLPKDQLSKLEVRQATTHAAHLGLDESEYQRISTELTHVVHIAWPMSFKQQLPSFNAAFKSVENLLQLCSDAHNLRPSKKPRFFFISSISTVGNYPSIRGERLIPEQATADYNLALDLGYAKAKLVCEKIVERAAKERPNIEAGFARVGQIAGARNGYWNTTEHFVALVKSSQLAGKFPDLKGTLSWLPVDSLAATIADIISHDEPLKLVYHLENPTRQSWHEMITCLSKELGFPQDSRVPFEKWLEIVGSLPEQGNPARELADFFQEDFRKMSSGEVVLDTATARSVSSTLRKMGPVEDDVVKEYVSYWRRIGTLK